MYNVCGVESVQMFIFHIDCTCIRRYVYPYNVSSYPDVHLYSTTAAAYVSSAVLSSRGYSVSP